MRSPLDLRLILTFCALTCVATAQTPTRPATPPEEPKPPVQQPQQPAQPQAAQPQPGQTQPAPATQTQPAQALPPSNAPRLADTGAFVIPNASLTEMISLLAERMKINYILDPNVQGKVSIYTYGEVKPVDYMPLLETILRVNGATIVKVGDLYRIIPIAKVSAMPLPPQLNSNEKTLPDDERMILNLVFLKYATANEVLNFVKPFLGEGASASVYEPANLLVMQDNARNMRRTMELIGMFDGDQFAGQRVRLFELENTRPTDMQRELDQVFKAYALSDKSQSVKFIPVDQINVLIAVAPNPGIFTQVQSWIEKLDIAVANTAGAVNSYVYRLKYGRAETIAMAIMALYSGNPYALVALSAMSQMQNQSNGGASYGSNGLQGGGNMNPMSMMMGMMGGMGGGGYGGGGYGGYGAPGYGAPGAYGANPYGNPMTPGAPVQTATPGNVQSLAQGQPNGAGQTGEYLSGPQYGGMQAQKLPHVIPNPFDNTILIQGTPQDYQQILSLLRQLDLPPRQVLIDAKIYEVTLAGAFSAGVSAYLQKKDTTAGGRVLNAASGAAGLTLSTGALVLKSHELLAALSANETKNLTKVISAPSIIATDSIAASLNVGSDVPVLTSQAVAGGVQQGGNSLFTNTVSSRSTGVTLNIVARVNSSGVVTLIVNQNVSSPQAPPAGGIQSPSFSNRSFQTQLTVQDGDTVAIGGIILESDLRSSAGVPFLHKLPGIGAAFGSKSISKDRTELIVFLTPRVIYDTNQMAEAADEIKREMKKIQKLSKDR